MISKALEVRFQVLDGAQHGLRIARHVAVGVCPRQRILVLKDLPVECSDLLAFDPDLITPKAEEVSGHG